MGVVSTLNTPYLEVVKSGIVPGKEPSSAVQHGVLCTIVMHSIISKQANRLPDRYTRRDGVWLDGRLMRWLHVARLDQYSTNGGQDDVATCPTSPADASKRIE